MKKIILLYPFNPQQRFNSLTNEEAIRLNNLLKKNEKLIGDIDPMSSFVVHPNRLPALEAGIIIRKFYGLKLSSSISDFLSVDEFHPKDLNKLYLTVEQFSWAGDIFLITSHEYVDEFGHYYSEKKFGRLGHYHAVPEGGGIFINNSNQSIHQLHL